MQHLGHFGSLEELLAWLLAGWRLAWMQPGGIRRLLGCMGHPLWDPRSSAHGQREGKCSSVGATTSNQIARWMKSRRI